MKEFEVEITSRPLGVRFAHADRGDTVVVHLVLEGRLGDKLGLEPGDILVGVNEVSLLNTSSIDALEMFRKQKVPYRAKFRRFEEEDEYEESEEEESGDENTNEKSKAESAMSRDAREQSMQTMIMKEEAEHIMAGLAVTPYHRKSKSVQLRDWSVQDVKEWLHNYGRALGNAKRFEKYVSLFEDNHINGKILRGLDRIDLSKMGIEDGDVHDLYVGIRELNNIIAVNADTLRGKGLKKALMAGVAENKVMNGDSNNTNSNKDKNKNEDDEDSKEEDEYEDDEDEDDDDEDEDDNWEAPFLPYMYEAPTVKLSAKTRVKVESARIVSPYKKKPFALYEIEVIDGDNEWLLSKRYNEFFKFYEEIKKMGVTVGSKAKFPGKGVWKSSTDKKVIEDRQRKLTIYLNALLTDHETARNSKLMHDFLSPSRTFVVDV